MTVTTFIFDVDGTLADTERDGHRVAFNKAFKAAGLDWDWSVELYGELLAVTGGKERIRFYLEKFNTAFAKPDDFDGFVAGLHASKTEFYTELLATGAIPLRSGVKRLMAESRAAGMRLAIATTTTPANVTALLGACFAPDAESWFEVIAAGDIVPAKKPAHDIYTYAMAQMKVSPEECVAFEDSENGIKSSVGAKLKTVVTINEYTKDHDFTDALIVLDQLGDPGDPMTVLEGKSDAEFVTVDLVKSLV
ncbi:MAG: HAD family hydrolase [Methylococcales bacterium]|jgi:HAD superfamily hydrolase (TIGR01509 family)|nr:HAD family hydrolase [Methylococcales bacterium]MBT7443973.1 HAD family hydrolase [Methylococcales bacterium]